MSRREVSAGHPLRILSIEDDPKDTELIQGLLETEGIVCEVTRVDTEAALLACVEQGGIDLILADYSLPSFDGISALKFAMKACPDVPFIFVSGTLGEEVAVEALKIGATDYVLKTRLSRLVPAVQRALREATQRTERRRAEEALRQSETYLAEAQRLSRTGSFGWNVSSGEIYWSEETYKIFEYDRALKPTLEFAFRRIHPDDRELVQQAIGRASEARTNLDFEHRLLMPDGSVKYLHVLARAVETSSGNLEYLGAVTDITAAKRTEDALRRSEAYQAEAQKLTHTGSWACDIAKREMRHSSEEHSRLYGFDPESGIPSFEEFVRRIHPEDRSRVVELAERANSAGKDFEAHFRIALPDGTTKYVYGVAHPAFNSSGDVAEFVGFVVDVTERKRVEEKLRQNQAYLHESQRLGHMGSWAYNASSGTLFASPELLRIFGRDPDQEKPTVEMFRGSVHPEDRAYVDETIDKAMREETDFGFDHRIVLPNGSIRHVYSMAHRVIDESDTFVIGTVMDVTERKRAEEALREAQADLARVSRVTTMGELTASLAHEIKQPITAAGTDARTCLRWLDRDDPDLPEAREAASRVVKDVTRAADIINRIGVLFKKGALQRELVDVNELIREMMVLLRSEASRYSIFIRTELAEDLPEIMADRVQLQQVFMNLMLNGIDAMKETTSGGELTIKSEASDGQLLVSVSDTGVGLPAEKAEQIFKAFFTTKDNGTGMGLPISRSIIESHGGRLWAACATGRGATFQFTLPAKLAAHA